MKFYVAGHYLIQGSPRQSWMDKGNLLPEKLWSGSSHICPKFPDDWILGWHSNRDTEAQRERENAREIMKISVDEFAVAQKDFNELLSKDQFGFPNVFMNRNIALEKYHQYFAAVPDLKLLGFCLPETYLVKFFVQCDAPGFEPFTRNGVYQKLKQQEILEEQPIGYDLLGFDGADYCSFLCGSMTGEIHDKYGVQFNEFGLVSDYQQAENVSQAIWKKERTAEEGFWAPWLVFEIKI